MVVGIGVWDLGALVFGIEVWGSDLGSWGSGGCVCWLLPLVAATIDEEKKDSHNANVDFHTSVTQLLKANQLLISKK